MRPDKMNLPQFLLNYGTIFIIREMLEWRRISAIPQLVSICINKKSLDWNFIGLCVLIENCRLEGHNPELPNEYQDFYFESLSQFEKYLLLNFKSITDQTALRLTLALFATVNGQPGLGRAIELLDEDLLPEFLELH